MESAQGMLEWNLIAPEQANVIIVALSITQKDTAK